MPLHFLQSYFHNRRMYKRIDHKTMAFHSRFALWPLAPQGSEEALRQLECVNLIRGKGSGYLYQHIVLDVGAKAQKQLLEILWWNYYSLLITDYGPVKQFIIEHAKIINAGKNSSQQQLTIPLIHVAEIDKDWYLRQWYYKSRYKAYFRRLPIPRIIDEVELSPELSTASLKRVRDNMLQMKVIGNGSTIYQPAISNFFSTTFPLLAEADKTLGIAVHSSNTARDKCKAAQQQYEELLASSGPETVKLLQKQLDECRDELRNCRKEMEAAVNCYPTCQAFAKKATDFFRILQRMLVEVHKLYSDIVTNGSLTAEEKDTFNYYYVGMLNKFSRSSGMADLNHGYETHLSDLAETGMVRTGCIVDKDCKSDTDPLKGLQSSAFFHLFRYLCGDAIILADDMASLPFLLERAGVRIPFDSRPFTSMSLELRRATEAMDYEVASIELFKPYAAYPNVEVVKKLELDTFKKNIVMDVLHLAVNFNGSKNVSKISINQ